ncbi:11247_t:CDS:2, partial [Paraglomus brasilianum]
MEGILRYFHIFPAKLATSKSISSPTQSKVNRTPKSSRTSSSITTLSPNRGSSIHKTSPSRKLIGRTSPSGQSKLIGVFKSGKSGGRVYHAKREVQKLNVIGKDWIGPVEATPKKAKNHFDRFIPNREAMDEESTRFNINTRPSKSQDLDDVDRAYQEEIARAAGISLDKRILAFNVEPPKPDKQDIRLLYSNPSVTKVTNCIKRRIISAPERILDAPGMQDDYYLNLLDWSVRNMVAIALDKSVYVWDAETGDVSSMASVRDDEYISGLAWSQDGEYLAIGTSYGDTQIWDIEKGSKVRSMFGHSARVGVLSWNKYILSSGCRDGSIWHHDIRIAEHKAAELLNHTSEVCGLKWRNDGALLASGGNDNRINVWDARSNLPKWTKNNHRAAVKAVAWCPWHANILATGGGSHDRNIHFWNTTQVARIRSIDTGSQVTSIIWSREYKEVLSTHGFPDNHITIWSYPDLKKIVDIRAHETRVLHSAISPDGQMVATAASDENLKFW